MGIADIAATTPSEVSKGPSCKVCLALASLPADEAAALRSLMSDRSWRYRELSDRLADEGVNLPYFSLSRHARGECQAREKLR